MITFDGKSSLSAILVDRSRYCLASWVSSFSDFNGGSTFGSNYAQLEGSGSAYECPLNFLFYVGFGIVFSFHFF